MQLIFLPPVLAVVLSIFLWMVMQTSAALLCLKVPDRYLTPDSFLFRMRRWERDGEVYNRILRVSRWKKFLPDGAAATKNGYRKKNMTDFSRENLDRFVIESCRAELSHMLAVLPFWVFGFFAPSYVIPIMFVYALAVNLPCVLVQRYNRPRALKLMKKIEVKSKYYNSDGMSHGSMSQS